MNRIAELRKKAGLSQKEFGKIINAAQNTVCNWELGNREPDYATLKKMRSFFGMSIEFILGINDEPIPEPAPPPEPEIVRAYNDASPEIQAAVRKLLDMDGEKNL